VTLVNNMIFGGNAYDAPANSPVYGLVIDDGSDDVVVQHNAIYAGSSDVAQATATAVSLGSITDLAFDKNIVFGHYGAEFAFNMSGCPAGKFMSFRDNVLFGFTLGGVLTYATNCPSPASTSGTNTSISGAELAMNIGATAASGNLEVALPAQPNNSCDPANASETDDCIAGLACAGACCATSVFNGWPNISGGYDLLFGAEAWKLSPDLDCVVWSTDLELPVAAMDFFGTARTVPTTIGPYEADTSTMCE